MNFLLSYFFLFVMMTSICQGIVAEGPDFMIIGIMKGGTSSLFHYLRQHPDIHIQPGTPKEIIFFKKSHRQSTYKNGMEWYLKQFPKKNLEHDFFITGEATAEYLGVENISKEVSYFFPDLKIIILIRNPVDRALSQYKMCVRSFGEIRPHEELFIQEMIDFQNNPRPTDYSNYIQRGIYAPQIQAWRECYPDNQILIICSEELFANPKKVVDQTFNFLGLSPFNLKKYKIINKGSNDNIKLSPDLRRQLLDFYAPYNEELKVLLRDEMHLEMNLKWNE